MVRERMVEWACLWSVCGGGSAVEGMDGLLRGE